jgi:hypothetical protein
MSFGGHVPVGTGQQLPYGTQPYQYTPSPQIFTPVVVYAEPQLEPVVLVLKTPHPTLNSVTVYRQGEPARQIPHGARAAMRQRMHYHTPHTPVVVQAQHYADARHGEVRQVPGTGRGVVVHNLY